MKYALPALTAALTLSLAPAGAQAATVLDSGNFAAGQYVYDYGSFGLSPGKYRVTLSFSTPPATFWGGWVEKQTVTNFYCEDPGTPTYYCGGDDVPTFYDFAPVSPTQYIANVTVNPFRSVPTPGSDPVVRYDEFDSCCDFYNFEFDAGEPGSYVLSLASVPEPGTWALMILGMGAIGAVMRGRVRTGSATRLARA